MTRKIPYLPLFLNLAGKPCLVVGGGPVAWRKAQDLLAAEADVTVVSPQAVPPLQECAAEGRCHWLQRSYQPPEAGDYHLVIATTDDPEVNRRVSRDGAARAVPVNVVDQPHLCSAIFPAVVRRGIVTAAVATGGQAPYFTRYLREQLEVFLDRMTPLRYPEVLVRFREFAKRHARDADHEYRLYRRLLAGEPAQWEAWAAQEPPYDLWRAWLDEEC
ncbi:MAG: bifunctional precorrin-2 dehydrogenase/sirohydrochlorin ferrochelatase [Candidatus Zixiibacteriota bacterium]|nr:MAG: bifunctional precorrin-2 dehydrogenase/sirohydrochlorin ferrochelatase [candidate division Zixibacteria bacterium]